MQTVPRLKTAAMAAALALVVAVAVAPPASAQEYAQAVGEAALAQIDYPIDKLGWSVQFMSGRSGYLGLAIGEERRIEIYVRSTHGVSDVAHTLAHELGHAVDLTYGSNYRRREYRRLRGLSPEYKWFGCDACSDYATPAGDFAEVFEYWLLGDGGFQSQLAGAPDSTTLEYLSTLFVEPPMPSVRVFWRQRWKIRA
jgi:hypothetical protein